MVPLWLTCPSGLRRLLPDHLQGAPPGRAIRVPLGRQVICGAPSQRRVGVWGVQSHLRCILYNAPSQRRVGVLGAPGHLHRALRGTMRAPSGPIGRMSGLTGACGSIDCPHATSTPRLHPPPSRAGDVGEGAGGVKERLPKRLPAVGKAVRGQEMATTKRLVGRWGWTEGTGGGVWHKAGGGGPATPAPARV